MATAARRLATNVGLGILVAGFAALVSAGEVQAATSPLVITAHLGYSDVIKPQAWMPISIAVTNTGPAVDGILVVQSVFGTKPVNLWPASYQRPLLIATGATKYFRTYVEEVVAGQTVAVQIVRAGRILASENAAATRTASTLVGVLSDDSTALDDFAAVHPGGVSATVVHLATGDLAESAIPLRPFDMLAVDDFNTDKLSAGQRTAIGDYVHAGGSLLVGTGASWRRTVSGLPADILPMQLGGQVTLDVSPMLGDLAGVQVATGRLQGGTAWLADGALPLLSERTVGVGTVTLATFDWTREPISGWSGTRPLLRQLLARTVYGSQAGVGSAQLNGGFPGPFGGPGGTLYQRSGAVSPALGSLPALELPSLWLTGLVVLVYVLLIGPVNFLVLRALHRRALAWITLPLIAALVAGGAYGGAILTKGQSVQTNQVGIVHLQPGTNRSDEETYTGVLTPTRGDYSVELGRPMLVGPISSYYGSGPVNRSDIRVDLDDGSIVLPGMTAFTLRGFATEEIVTHAPVLAGHLEEINGLLTGTIQNRSSSVFTDAVVIAGGSYQRLGALGPGASVAVSLAPTSVVRNGPPAISGIYPNYMYGPQFGPPNAALRDGQAKTQILSLLTNSVGFKGLPSTGSVPLVVAWSSQPVRAVTVNGSHPRAKALTAVALELPVEQVGVGVLPSAVVSGRIIDVDGTSQSGPPGVLYMQNGSVTFDFTPNLAAGARLSGAGLSSSNPYFVKGVGTGSNSPPTAQAWDWSRSDWVAIDYQMSGTTALPEATVDPSTGEVRVRVLVGPSGFMAADISLVGTVR